MPMRSHNLLYLVTLAVISYIWIIFISITTRITWITLIIFLAIIIKVLRFISGVMMNDIIWNWNLRFAFRSCLNLACGTVWNFWYLCCDLIPMGLIISFSLNFLCNQVIIIFRRLMYKNETLFLFRRHCLIHYN